MSGERLYDEAGERPWTDVEEAEAIRQYRADHPNERSYVGIEGRIRRLNAEAHERAEAEAAGVSLPALQTAKAELRRRKVVASRLRDLAAARRYVAGRPEDPDRAIARLRKAVADGAAIGRRHKRQSPRRPRGRTPDRFAPPASMRALLGRLSWPPLGRNPGTDSGGIPSFANPHGPESAR